jgi:hypothetical protein
VRFTKDALLKDEFDEWLIRIICYAFSVPPTAFVKQTNRATADNASDTAMQEGLAPLQSWVKALIDRVLAEDFAAPDLEFQWNQDRSLSPSDAMTINTGYVAAGLKTRNEARADLGLGPLPGGDIALVTTATGLVPIAPTPLGKDWHFDPSQPRDDRGRWTAGGGGASGGEDEEGDGDATATSSMIDASDTTTVSQTYGDQVSDADYAARAKILEFAQKYVGSEEWADDATYGPYEADTDKCNVFVYEVLADAGANPGTPNGRFHVYPPLAAQWADPTYDIPGWYVLGSNEAYAPGDVVAQPIHYIGTPTGHVMIVGPNNTVIGTGPGGVIEQIPMPDKLGPTLTGPMVFRRWRSTK